MGTAKISVIVPIFNTERWLRRCVDSILAQTYRNFELLLIDDGSTDSSASICDSYVHNADYQCIAGGGNPIVKVFHKRNGGVSSARNLGLDNAGGEWVVFIDSDDHVTPDYLQRLLDVSAGTDFVVANMATEGEREWNEVLTEGEYENDSLRDIIAESCTLARFTAPWCKLYKRELIGDNRFPTELSTQEDAMFNFRYLTYIKNLRVINDKIYLYNRLEPDSLSKSLDNNHRQQKEYLEFAERHVNELSEKYDIPSHQLAVKVLSGYIHKEIAWTMEKKPSLSEIYRDLKLKSTYGIFRQFYQTERGTRQKIYARMLKSNMLRLLSLYIYIGSRTSQVYN